MRPGPSSFLSLAHPLLWDRDLHSLSGMLRDSRRLSGRTRANPRPAQTQHLRLGSLVAVAGAFPAAHYRPSAWWLGGGRVSWGWEVVQLPVSALAAEPWPPDALPLSLHPRSLSKAPTSAGSWRPVPPVPPSVPPPPGELAGVLGNQQWPPLFLHPAASGIALHCWAFLSCREEK